MKNISYILIAVVMAHSSTYAEKLAEYTFSEKTMPVRSTDYARNSDADSLVPGRGMDKSRVSFSGLGQSPASLLMVNASFNQAEGSGALDARDYLSFSVEIDEDYQAALSKLEFYTLRRDLDDEGHSAPDSFAVYSSADGFAAPVGSGKIALQSGDARSWEHQVLDLTAVPELQSVTEEIEFRIVLWVSQGIGKPEQRTFRLDDISLWGTVSEDL